VEIKKMKRKNISGEMYLPKSPIPSTHAIDGGRTAYAAAVQTPECSTKTNKLAGSGTPGAFSMLELGGGMEHRVQTV
jgi:hypothetical protein